MGIIVYIILDLIFFYGVFLADKHKTNSIWLAIATLLIIFQLPSIINNVNIPYEGYPISYYSSSLAYYVGLIFYYIGYFIWSVSALLLTYIPVIVKIKKEKKNKT